MKRLLLASAFAAIMLSTVGLGSAQTPAPSQGAGDVLTKVTIDNIKDALLAAGFRAETKEDSRGPYVQSASSGQAFFASLEACDDQQVCRTLVLETATYAPKTEASLDTINQFNSENNGWATVTKSTTDGKFYASYRTLLTGGVTKAWLQANITAFATTVDNFVAFTKK